MPVNYKNAVIYMVWSPSTDLLYYGATTQIKLSCRMTTHRIEFKKFNEGKRTRPLGSYPVIEIGDARIVLVEKVPCDNKDELDAIKNKYIRENACVN